MSTDQVLILARKHLGGAMETSARLCLADAIELKNDGRLDEAKLRAVKSLAYSVGILSPVYQAAAR